MHFPRSLLLLSAAFVAFHSTNAEAELSIMSDTHLRPNGAQTTDARHALKDEKEAIDFVAAQEERMPVSLKQNHGMIPWFEGVKIPGFVKRIWKNPLGVLSRLRGKRFMKKRA